VALVVEEARLGELGDEAAVVAGDLGDGVVGERGDAVAVQHPPHGGRVVGHEGVGDVLPGQAQQREVPARVVRQPGRDVVDLPLHSHPHTPSTQCRAISADVTRLMSGFVFSDALLLSSIAAGPFTATIPSG
jgi:hypothetical protein